MLGGTLAILGLVLSLAGWAMGARTNMTVNWFRHPINVGIYGFGWRSDSAAGNSRTESGLEDFTELNIDVDLGDVTVQTGEEYSIALQWDDEIGALEYSNENGVLRIWSKNDGISLMSNLGGEHAAQVTVCIPESEQLRRVTVDTDLGKIDLSGLSAQELEVDAALGSVRLSDVNANTLTAGLDLGDLTVERTSVDEADLRLSLGSLTAKNLDVAKRLDVDADMGGVELSGSLRGETTVSASMGDVEVNTSLEEAEYSYELDVSMGSVRVNGAKCGDSTSRSGGRNTLDIRSDMGDVRVNFGVGV